MSDPGFWVQKPSADFDTLRPVSVAPPLPHRALSNAVTRSNISSRDEGGGVDAIHGYSLA